MQKKFVTALPVFNEAKSVDSVLDEVSKHSEHILVVDDGSTDGTTDLLVNRTDIELASHEQNQGYGAALKTAFEYAARNNFEFLVTVDCDGQHEPQRINQFVEACDSPDVDIVSGSRYLQKFSDQTEAPEQRRRINMTITEYINQRLGFQLTDSFCGFKAYRVESLRKLEINETGYAMPLELWVQAAYQKLKVIEVAVPLIYLDENRSFGGELDDGDTRLKYYYEVINRSLAAVPDPSQIQGHCVG